MSAVLPDLFIQIAQACHPKNRSKAPPHMQNRTPSDSFEKSPHPGSLLEALPPQTPDDYPIDPLAYLLHSAAEHGRLRMVVLAIQQRADANHGDPSALVRAVQNHHVAVVKHLSAYGARGRGWPDVVATAVRDNQMEIVQALLATPRDRSTLAGALAEAASRNDLKMARMLLEHGADVRGLGDAYSAVMIRTAANNGDAEMVGLLLDAGGVHDGSPLRAAADQGFDTVARLLLESGSCTNVAKRKSFLVYSDIDSAGKALDDIQQNTVMNLEYAREDVVFRPSPRDDKEPNPIVCISHLPYIKFEELEKIMRCYRGFESFDIIDDDTTHPSDRKSTRHPPKHDSTPYITFRDVFCAERAIDDLCDYTNITATFSSDPDRIRKLIAQSHHTKPQHHLITTPRINLETLSWLHISNIPTDISYSTLHRHFTRLEGHKFTSFQPESAFLLGFANQAQATKALTNLERNTKMNVRPAEKADIKHIHKSHHPRKVSPPSTSIFVRMPAWLPSQRLVALCSMYEGYKEAVVKKDHLVVTFGNVEEARAMEESLDSTTDLYVDYLRGHGGGSKGRGGDDESEVGSESGYSGGGRRKSNFSGVRNEGHGHGGRARSVDMDNASVGSSRRGSAAHLHVSGEGSERPASRTSSADVDDASEAKVHGGGGDRFDKRGLRDRHLMEGDNVSVSSDNESMISDMSTGPRRPSLRPFPRASRSESPLADCRTIYVGNVLEADKAAAKHLVSTLPGFHRIHFGQSNFRVMFDNSAQARDAMGRLREHHREWKTSYARKELEEKVIETVGEESKVIWISTLYWTEPSLRALFSAHYPSFDHLDYQAAHSWVHFKDVQSAKHALEELNSQTNLYAVFSSKYVRRDVRGVREERGRDRSVDTVGSSGVRHAWEVDEAPRGRREVVVEKGAEVEVTEMKGSKLFGEEIGEEGSGDGEVVKAKVSAGAEHFPMRRVDAPRPKQMRSNILQIRNSAISSQAELETIFNKYSGFDSLHSVKKGPLTLWYVKFTDVASAESVYGSYELRETLGKGYGGVSFLYRATDDTDIPSNWIPSVIVEDTADEATPAPPAEHQKVAPQPVADDHHDHDHEEHPHHDHDDGDDYHFHDGAAADPWSLPPSSREATPEDVAAMEANGRAEWGWKEGVEKEWDVHQPWYESVDDDDEDKNLPPVDYVDYEMTHLHDEHGHEHTVAGEGDGVAHVKTESQADKPVRRSPSLAELVEKAPVFVPSAGFGEAIPEEDGEGGEEWEGEGGDGVEGDGTEEGYRKGVEGAEEGYLEEEDEDLEDGQPVHVHVPSAIDNAPGWDRESTPCAREATPEAIRITSLLSELATLRSELVAARRMLSLMESEVGRVVKMVEEVGGVEESGGEANVWGKGEDGELGEVEKLQRVVKGLVREVLMLRKTKVGVERDAVEE
ncbi:hypothetical protein HDV00_005640 [Rhizophlyctis rosea]|nr:hypothetical protein HDV00_005640 [Rhizophlyctis rosea]